MPDRLLVILGLLRLTQHPSEEPGDRYWVGAVVVNLTGRGDASREYEWRGANLQALLKPRELNLAALDAGEVLDQVERGAAPVEALAWVPTMQRGDDSTIIQRWLDLARDVRDHKRRAELVLAVVFAELAGREEKWIKALEEWNMTESKIIGSLLAAAEAKAEAKGKTEGKAEMLVEVLQKRFKKVPDDLRARILAEQQSERLSDWSEVALGVRSLRKFRERAGL
jgi:hypothetical protein